MFKVKTQSRAEYPSFILSEYILKKIGEVSSLGVVDNVIKQRQTDGSRIRPNAQSTRLRKQQLGRPVLSLIDAKHRFIRGRDGSFSHEVRKAGRGKVSIFVRPSTGELRQINRWVQQKGYVGWFGLSELSKAAIRKIIREFIKSEFAKAAASKRGG